MEGYIENALQYCMKGNNHMIIFGVSFLIFVIITITFIVLSLKYCPQHFQNKTTSVNEAIRIMKAKRSKKYLEEEFLHGGSKQQVQMKDST